MLVFEKNILFNSPYRLRPNAEELVTYVSLCSCHTRFELKNMTKILYIGFSKLRDNPFVMYSLCTLDIMIISTTCQSDVLAGFPAWAAQAVQKHTKLIGCEEVY